MATSAGSENVKRQHMGNLQHNKFIAVNGSEAKLAVCGSTNFSWRAFYVQNNNAVVMEGPGAVRRFFDAFDNYWQNDRVADFGGTDSAARWAVVGLSGIDAEVVFSHCRAFGATSSVDPSSSGSGRCDRSR